MIKTIIFDLGDVVVPSSESEIVAQAAKLFDADGEKMQSLMDKHIADLQIAHISEIDFWQKIIEEGGLKKVPRAELDKLFIGPFSKNFIIDEDIVSLIEQLKKKYTVGCISNTITSHVEFFRQQGLCQYFDPCILSNEVKIRKPDKAIYDLYTDQAQCRADEAVFITEVEPQLSGAAAAGLQSIRFQGVADLKAELKIRYLI